jgi:uncharacterized membrane protein
MSYALPVAISLHLLATIVWVGGMFFAHMALRPAAMELEPATRLALWRRVFGRFFPWVWAALILVLGSGYWMALGPVELGAFGGMQNVRLSVHVMSGIGVLMALLFLYIWLAPYRRLKAAVDNGAVAEAAAAQARIRQVITVNLALGLIVAVIGVAGRYLPS